MQRVGRWRHEDLFAPTIDPEPEDAETSREDLFGGWKITT
jgi:hypothetical protein